MQRLCKKVFRKHSLGVHERALIFCYDLISYLKNYGVRLILTNELDFVERG